MGFEKKFKQGYWGLDIKRDRRWLKFNNDIKRFDGVKSLQRSVGIKISGVLGINKHIEEFAWLREFLNSPSHYKNWI